MTCHEFHAQLTAYLAGTLSDAESMAVEQHASHCADCEHRLLAATDAVAIAGREVAPVVPAEVRKLTLAAVRDAREAHRLRVHGRMRWVGGLTGLAAAAGLVVALRGEPRAAPVASADTTVALASPGGLDTASETGVVVDSRDPYARVADAEARAEFAQLDAASAELRSALDAAPNDAQLRAFLSAVEDRRAELTQRVKDASS